MQDVRGAELLANRPVSDANRSVDKALQLSQQFAELGYLLGCGYDMLGEQSYDLLSMAPAPVAGQLPPLLRPLLPERLSR